MPKKDKKVDLGHDAERWNTVKYDRLSRPQVDALQMARAAHDGNVRWSAVELMAADEVGGYIELTLHFIDAEAREAMRQDPTSTYARRVVVLEDGSVRVKEMTSL